MGRYRKTNLRLPPRMQQKNGHFYWTPFVAGKLKWVPLGNNYLKALAKLSEFEGLEHGAETVAQLLDRAFKVFSTRQKPSTLKESARALNNLKPAFEKFTPRDVKPKHIAQYLETRSAKVSANREIAFFSSAWEIARRQGWIDLPNPAIGIKRNKERNRKRVALPAEINALLALDEPIADMVELTLMTALRESDLLNLTIQSIERGGLRVKPRKTDESTEVELFFRMTPRLQEVLDRAQARPRRTKSDYLFPVQVRARAGQAYTVNSFQNVWRRYFERCGITGLTWHDLRRTALNLRARAEGVEAAKALGGHSSITTTEGYLAGVGAAEVAPIDLNFRSEPKF